MRDPSIDLSSLSGKNALASVTFPKSSREMSLALFSSPDQNVEVFVEDEGIRLRD